MTERSGERIEQLREELAELRAEVERLKAEKRTASKHKKPTLRVIKGGLGAAALGWIHEHWRSATISAAASMLAAGALTWNYEISPEQIDIPETQPKPTTVTRTTVPTPRHTKAAPPQNTPRARIPAPKGTAPPTTPSTRPTPAGAKPSTTTPTPSSTPTIMPRLREGLRSAVPEIPDLTLPPLRLELPKLRPSPGPGQCLRLIVTVCPPAPGE